MNRPPVEKHLTDSEVRALLSVIETIEDKALTIFGLTSGCRVSEVVHLRVQDIDYDRQVCSVWDEKKDLTRTIILPKDALQIIRMALNARSKVGEYVFPFSYKTANRRFKALCRKAGISPAKAHWHCLRHTFVVRARLAGWDTKAIQQQTGDSELTILRVYSTLTPEERVQIAESKPILPAEGGHDDH